MSKIKENLDRIEERISVCCDKASRRRDQIRLVAVTKTAGIEQIKELYDLGYRVFGENRLDHLEAVAAEMDNYAAEDSPVQWEMIGHIQRNKAKRILPIVSSVHSLDSLRLAKEIEKNAGLLGRGFDVFIQVNSSGEPQKYGAEPEAVSELAGKITDQCPSIRLVGLMTMAPFTDDVAVIAECFRRTRWIYEDVKKSGNITKDFNRLSMGMTNDYEIAIAEGATDLRIGSAIFK